MRPPLFRTRITELFGIAHPLLCGGMMWLGDGRYVAAVVNAGGMGFITAVSFPEAEEFRRQIRLCRDLTNGKPFGVNISISRRPGVNERLRPHVEVAIEEGVRFVETSGSSPEALLPRLQAAGMVVMHKVPAVRYAVSAAKLGVDAVCVIGGEAGGHPGNLQIGSMVQVADAARRIAVPLVVGGGIGCGAQLAAALAMGADAVLLGTRMVVAEEIWAHPAYKQRVVQADGTDSRIVMGRFGHHHRVLDNDAARAVAALEAAGESDFARYEPLVRGTAARDAYASGDTSQGMIDYGPAAVFADAVKPVEAIFDELLDDAAAAMRRLAGLTRERE
jgi:nitronate monooxygenase